VLRALLSSGLGRAFGLAVVLLALFVCIGLGVLWPDGSRTDRKLFAIQPAQKGEVIRTQAIDCQGPQNEGCVRVTAELLSGPDKGSKASFDLGQGGADPGMDVGDRVRLTKNQIPEGAPAGVVQPYSFQDFERRAPMVWLVVLFSLLVVGFGRWRGFFSLIGLGVSLVIVIAFIVPAILDGREPVPVAIVGSLAIMLVTISLAHGLGAKSVAAMLGTAAALAVTVSLALLFTELTNLTGLASEEASLLQVGQTDLNLQGLILSGMIIAALGVLDDVTVSQASAVLALRKANPVQRFRELYRRAIDVGHDHVAATVNTLVLAYVGASLPIVLIFTVGGARFADAVNTEAVATQVVATLVGSIGLIVAVPITTALAGLLAMRLPADVLSAEAEHAHAH